MTIANTRLKLFLPYVMPHVEGCPRPIAELALRNAVIEYCEKTRAWRSVISVALTQQNQTLAPPANAAIHEIEEATFDGCPLIPTQYTSVEPDSLTGDVSLGQPRYITQIAPDTMSIYPFQAGTVRMSLFLKPRSGQSFATDTTDPLHDAFNIVPAFFLTQHAETIASGALARLFAMPKQRFTNADLAVYNARRFMDDIDRKAQRQMSGQQRAPVRTKAVWF